MAATSIAKKSKAPARMPIEDYDRLSVKAILPLLTTLSGPELQAVVAHEKAGKNRVTLLKSVRKVEQAREAATYRTAPESHLTVVEDAEEPVANDADDSWADDAEDSIDADKWLEDAQPVALDADDAWAIDADDSWAVETDEPAIDDPAIDDPAIDDIDEPVAVPVVAVEPAPKKRGRIGSAARPAAIRATAPRATAKATAKATATVKEEAPEPIDVVATETKPRPPVKAATWEEEPRLELPKRLAAAAAAYELDFEPAPVALVPPLPSAESSSVAPAATPRTSGSAKVRRKFEGAALVMAAVLAVLLGLAIGTILVRGGSVSADSTPTSVSTQSAPVQAGG